MSLFKFVSIFGLLISFFKEIFGIFNFGPLISRFTFGNFKSRFPSINPEILSSLSKPHNSCFGIFNLKLSSISPLNICFKVIQFFPSLSKLESIKLIFILGFLISTFNSGTLISVSIFGFFISTPSIFPFMLKSGTLILFFELLDILIFGILIFGPLMLIFPLGISNLSFPLIIPELL